MNAITSSSLTRSVVENPLVSSLLALAVWIAGAAIGSGTLIIASGIIAYGRPLLYSALTNSEGKKSEKTRSYGLSSIRPSVAGVR